MNVHSMTLKTVTSRPAIPMDRSSLMGTVSSAENPIATVVAEMISVRPACSGSNIGGVAGIMSLDQCFAKPAHHQ